MVGDKIEPEANWTTFGGSGGWSEFTKSLIKMRQSPPSGDEFVSAFDELFESVYSQAEVCEGYFHALSDMLDYCEELEGADRDFALASIAHSLPSVLGDFDRGEFLAEKNLFEASRPRIQQLLHKYLPVVSDKYHIQYFLAGLAACRGLKDVALEIRQL